jgi:hypothetical protein
MFRRSDTSSSAEDSAALEELQQLAENCEEEITPEIAESLVGELAQYSSKVELKNKFKQDKAVKAIEGDGRSAFRRS